MPGLGLPTVIHGARRVLVAASQGPDAAQLPGTRGQRGLLQPCKLGQNNQQQQDTINPHDKDYKYPYS